MFRSFFLAALVVPGFVICTDCPNAWIAFEGSCYYFGHEAVDFLDARRYCQTYLGDLVKVDSQNENKFLKSMMNQDFNHNYWIGMTDDHVEGIWIWISDLTNVISFDWGHGEPSPHNPSHPQDCSVFWGDFQHQWGDIECSAKLRPVCELV